MYSYAHVANRSYRPGPTPATPSLTRSSSNASVARLTNVTNTPQAVAVPDAVSPLDSQPREVSTGNVPVAAAKGYAPTTLNAPVAMKENMGNATNAPSVRVSVNGSTETATNARTAPVATRATRPKRKAAVDAPKSWETEKKRSRGSKKSRVDAPEQTNASANNANALNASVPSPDTYFATPPPCATPQANTFVSVRQPAPREKAKFRSYEVEWSDAQTSTPSEAAGPTAEDLLLARDAPEEEYISKRRQTKARKKSEHERQVTEAHAQAGTGTSTPAAETSNKAVVSSSTTAALTRVKKSPKIRRSSGSDRHRLSMIKKGKGKEIQRSPSPSLERNAGRNARKKKGKDLPASRDSTDVDSHHSSDSGDDASDESEGGENEYGAGYEYNIFENAAVVVGSKQMSIEDVETPRPMRRPGRAAKRFKEETVTVVRSSDELEKSNAPFVQNGSPLTVPAVAHLSHTYPHLPEGLPLLPHAFPPHPDRAQFTGAFLGEESAHHAEEALFTGTFAPHPHDAQIPHQVPLLTDPFSPHSVAAEQPTSFPPLHDSLPPLAPAAQSLSFVSQAAHPDSIEIVNTAHPKLKDQPVLVKMTLRAVWGKAGAAILKNKLLMEHIDRNRVVSSLGIQAALELCIPEIAGRLNDSQSIYFSGFYRLTMERMSAIRGNMKATIKPALTLYNIPLIHGAALPVIQHLLTGRRYIYPDADTPHWEEAYGHPAIITAIRHLLYDTIKPAELPIASYDPGLFIPPDHAYGFEDEIPASVVASAATLVFYSIDCLTRDPNGKNQPDITEDKYRREYAFHSRSMENLQQMPRIRHERLSWLYGAVQSQLQDAAADALTWG